MYIYFQISLLIFNKLSIILIMLKIKLNLIHKIFSNSLNIFKINLKKIIYF